MGKLQGRGLPSRLRKPPSRTRRKSAPGRPGPTTTVERPPWHKWYYLARWRDLRWSVLEAAMFTCEWCGRIEPDTSKLVADHKEPHRGDPDLFWDRENLQCLCAPCHSSRKQRLEARGEGG